MYVTRKTFFGVIFFGGRRIHILMHTYMASFEKGFSETHNLIVMTRIEHIMQNISDFH